MHLLADDSNTRRRWKRNSNAIQTAYLWGMWLNHSMTVESGCRAEKWFSKGRGRSILISWRERYQKIIKVTCIVETQVSSGTEATKMVLRISKAILFSSLMLLLRSPETFLFPVLYVCPIYICLFFCHVLKFHNDVPGKINTILSA